VTANLRPSPVAPTIDLEAEGKRHGFLRLPHSRDDSAWGAVMIPVCVVRRGDGPTALLTGANHGDEYEGPVALAKLARELEPADVSGRVIIVPFMNEPAFRAGRRTSPIDGGNLNRAFPGRPDGTITERIADYFQRHLLPLADYVLDFHSGGRTLDFLPMTVAHELPDEAQQARCEAAMRAFAAPYRLILRELDSVGMYDTAAEALGKVFVSTELGGGGTATARSVAIAERGVRNLLRHAGITRGEIEGGPGRLLRTPDAGCYVIAEHAGLVEPCADLGDAVGAGDPLLRIWPAGRTGADPVEYRARRDGLLVGRHFPGLAQAGDCLAVLAVEEG
jgi:N2-acetyl-L-2,4-diaminobutanoate deacetylase